MYNDDKEKPEFSKDGRTALTSDSGHIPPSDQWEETIQVSDENDE